jgi:DNA-binding NtrC family response regulator
MLAVFKDKIGRRIALKGASLAMILDQNGDICWHKGRAIVGGNATQGSGYPVSLIRDTLLHKREILERDHLIYCRSALSPSAVSLKLLCVLMMPISSGYFLYVDSGTHEGFSDEDLLFFHTCGLMLADIIDATREAENRLVTNSEKQLDDFRAALLRYALSDEPVLLLGETGVGKSYWAQKLHQYSGRIGKFIAAHIPGFSETLVESQLFGHKKGSFTGAVADAGGFIEEAEAGTLFLDEIADASLELQAKLLRFIDTLCYNRLGDTKERQSTARLVFATNCDLQAAVREKRFREDLYFRIMVLTLEIPPLRCRKHDIAAIVDENKHVLGGKQISPQAMNIIMAYDWPGNLRQLLNTLKKAALDIPGNDIDERIENVIHSTDFRISHHAEPHARRDQILADLKKGGIFWQLVHEPFLKRDLNRQQVKDIIRFAYETCNHNYKDAMSLLNIPDRDYRKFLNFLAEHKVRISDPDEVVAD